MPQLHRLNRERLVAAAENFPSTSKMLRRAAILLAMKRYLILVILQVRGALPQAQALSARPERDVSEAPALRRNDIRGPGAAP